MSRTTRLTFRLTAGSAAALTVFGLSATTTWADPLPLPLPSIPVVSTLTKALPPLPGPAVPKVPATAPSVVAPVTGAVKRATTSLANAVPAAPKAPAAAAVPPQVLNPLTSLGSSVKSGITSFNQAAAGTPLAGKLTAGPGGIINLAVNAAPLAQACAQATGSGTAILNTTITVGGHNITAQLVELLPGVLAACPSGSVTQPPGSAVGVDGTVGSLVGACVRINRSGLPLNASILVLTTELIKTLTDAGVPLQQLVVPCPTNSTSGNPGTPGRAGTPVGTNAGGTNANGANGQNAGNRGANSAVPAGLNAVNAGDSLPHTGADILPWVFYGLVLLGGGTALTIAAKRRAALATVTKS